MRRKRGGTERMTAFLREQTTTTTERNEEMLVVAVMKMKRMKPQT